MTVALIRGVRQKPLQPLRVNLGHPLARDLAAFLYHPAKAGLWDAVSGAFTATTEGSPAVVASHAGATFSVQGDVRAAVTARNPLAVDTNGVTLIACARVRAQPGSIGMIAGYAHNSSYRGIVIGQTSATAGIGWGIMGSNGIQIGGTSGAADTDRFRTVGVSVPSGTAYSWLDGVAQGSFSYTGNMTDTAQRIIIGRDPQNYATFANADILWIAAFNRVLNDDEHAWWHRDPFAVLESYPDRRLWGVQAGGGGAITLNADQGTISVTGYAATTTFSVAAAQGTVSVSGQAAAVSFGMAAAHGSVAVSGQASTIAFLAAAAQGSVSVAGQAATVAWAMAGDQGSVAITGYDATFDLPATGNITMDADTGTVTIAGFPAAAAFAVQTEHGSISVTGQASAVLWGLNADLGTVALVGYDADFDGAEPAPATNIGVGYYPVRKRRRVKIGAEIFWDDQRAAIAAALERLRAASPAPEADSSAAPRPASREAEPGTEALVASAANDPVPELASAAEFAAYEAEVLAWERRRARNAQALAALLLTET